MAPPPRVNSVPDAVRVRFRVKPAAVCVGVLRKGALLAALLLGLGCSEVSTRNVSSLLFDGVPAPPLPEKYCAPYLASLKTQQDTDVKGASSAKPKGSIHPPYEEKKCDNCHDKTKESGLVAPPNELCFICHSDIIKGDYVHAPAAAGDCLACHLPHDSSSPFLLARENSKLCSRCHQEARLSEGIHGKFVSLNIPCFDCHNPHAGPTRTFFK